MLLDLMLPHPHVLFEVTGATAECKVGDLARGGVAKDYRIDIRSAA